MRYYQVGDKLYPSVTTVLSVIRKPGLERWRGNLGNDEADRIMYEAGNLGSTIHDICQQINNNQPYIALDEQQGLMANAYQAWFNSTVKEVVAVEEAIVSSIYCYAGRLDLLAVLKGDRLPTLIDIKTGNSIYADVPLQLAAYKNALAENGQKAKRRLVIHIDKKNPGKLSIKEYSDHEIDLRMFLYVLELYRYINGNYNPKPNEIVNLKEDYNNVSSVSA